MQQTFSIPEYNLPKLDELSAKLLKRAKKLGFEPITITKTGFKDEAVKEDGVERIVRFIDVSVSGETPRIKGWKFVATIEHTTEGNIYHGFSNTQIPAHFRNSEPVCEHCKKIRNRKDTYIIENDEQFMQVGRSCLKDFFGREDVYQLADWLQSIQIFLSDLKEVEEDKELGYGKVATRVWLKTFLSYVVMVMERNRGFVTGTMVRELKAKVSTANEAINEMFPAPNYKPQYPTEEQKQKADEKLEWAREYLEAKGDTRNDFEHNLYVVIKSESLELRTAGIAAYLVPLHARIVGEQIERSKRKNEFFGNVGERIELVLKYIRSVTFDTMYGPKTIITFRDLEGRTFSWGGTGGAISEILNCEPDTEIRVKGTIKEHSVYKDTNQTVLTRVKFVC